MRLHLESIDWPDPAKNYQPEFSQVQGQTYEGKRIHVDNHQYGQCRFVNCTFVYSGGPFGFSECVVEKNYYLALTGSARRTLDLREAFREYSEQLRQAGPF